MEKSLRITCDTDAGVLYARRVGVRIATSRYGEADTLLVLNLDAEGDVVGLQLEGALELTPAEWRQHPDRGLIPPDMLAKIDGWFSTCWADARSEACV